MYRSFAFMLSLFFASPVFAADLTRHSRVTERDGLRFEYVTRLEVNDRVRISGRFDHDSKGFDLLLLPSGKVRGKVGGSRVSFKVAQDRRDTIVAELKAGAQPAMAGAQPEPFALAKN